MAGLRYPSTHYSASTGRSIWAEDADEVDDYGGMSAFERRLAYYRNIIAQNSPAAPKPEDTQTLSVKNVNLDIKNNTFGHHTNDYDITDKTQGETNHEYLVIRRGQTYNVTVEFNRDYDKTKDDLRFVFQFGKKPIPSKRTHVEFVLSDKDEPNKWGGWIKSTSNNSINVSMMTPPDCNVGKWKLRIDVVKKKDVGVDVIRYTHPDPIYILFNPWCKEDGVYIEDEKLLEEYVLNDKGKIYYGTKTRIGGRKWAYSQFDDNVLDCILYLLDKGMTHEMNRGNPVRVARKLSQMVNSSDDTGVLTGNWSGDYSGGKSPLKWTGSGAILAEYWATKQPVKFGQCWVFSGVLTTACRAVGIPARSVTNYASAHDTDGSITIDLYYDEKCEPIEHMNDDSVWNFHVWNDVWMSRPDMPPGYGGWQAIDATPQETSEGIYCCGPTSLKALKNGEVSYQYDGPFVYGEVNADRIHWVPGPDGETKPYWRQTDSIGKFISTKMPGSNDREDVTHYYKHAEGSEEERASVKMANLFSSAPDFENTAGDMEFTVDYDADTFVGMDIVVTATLKNPTDSPRTVSGNLTLRTTYYTGIHYKHMQTEKIKNCLVKPKSEEKVTIKLTQDEYKPKMTDHLNFKSSFMSKVAETGQNFAEVSTFRLRKPHLDVKAPSTAKVGEVMTVDVSFKNQLNETMTDCILGVAGPGLQKDKYMLMKNVPAYAEFSYTFDLVPSKPGERELIVIFSSKQVEAISGTHDVTVSA